jgi:hypothetical protein
VPGQEARHDPDDPAARGSNACALPAQALFQLPALRGLLLAAGGASGVFGESHRTRMGAVYPGARRRLASAPGAGRGTMAVGTGAALVGERSADRVSAAQRGGSLSGGRQYLEGQAREEKPAGQERPPQRVRTIHFWFACRHPHRAVGCRPHSVGLSLGQTHREPRVSLENALLREMLGEVLLPAWCKKVVVVADAAYPLRADLQAMQARSWYFVIAFPRTWKLANGQYLRDVVTHLPIHHYRQVRIPSLVPTARRRVFWTFAKRAQLAHVGAVTVVLSRRRRNDSPQPTKLLVPNLPPATAPLPVALYLRRWPVALCIKELKSVVGVGQHQVTKDAARGERSVAIAVMAYRVLLRLRAKPIEPGTSWSAFTLKQELAWEWGTDQLHRTIRPEARKELRRQRTVEPPPLRLAA